MRRFFTPNACEGTSTLFETNISMKRLISHKADSFTWRRRPRRLAKSIASAHVSRREVEDPSPSDRILDGRAEVAFNDLYDNMELAEQFVEYIVQRTLKNRPEENEGA